MNLSAHIAATFNRSGAARNVVVGAAAMSAVSHDSKGSGAPSSRRAFVALIAALAVLASLAFTAAPASAAPEAASCCTISDISYTTVHLKGKFSSPGGAFGTDYAFQYSKDPDTEGWSDGYRDHLGNLFDPMPVANKQVEATITLPRGGTEYFVRLLIGGFEVVETASPEPNPSFTTLAVEEPTIPGDVVASQVFSTSASATATVKRPANEDPAFDVECRFEFVSDAQFDENLINHGSEAGFDGATPVPCEQNPVDKGDVDAGRERQVSAQLGGLSPSTEYHLRLLAENAAPGVVAKEATSTFTTEPQVAKPLVSATDDASDVSYRKAKASGTVERPAGEDPALDITSCRFEFVTDALYEENVINIGPEAGFEGAGQAQCPQLESGPISASGPTAVTAELTGLTSGAEYHLRLVAENSSGAAAKEAPNTFTTTPGGDPTFTLDTAPIAGPTKARLTGTVTPGLGFESPEIYALFQYTEVGTENWCCGNTFISIPNGSGPQPFTYVIDGLTQDTEYEFRMNVEERDADESVTTSFSPEPNPTATTAHLEAPTASCDPVTGVGAATAHFSCIVDTHAPAGPLNDLVKDAYKTDWHFECTPACPGPGGAPISGTVQAEENSKTISVDAKRLEAGTYYEVKLVATNELYSAETALATFDTDKIPPSVKQGPGASDSTGGYVLQGTVNPNNQAVTDCKFEWGPSANELVFSADCSPMPIPGAKPTTVEAPLAGLTPDANYYSLLVVTYGAGLEEDSGGPVEFTPTRSKAELCPNEQLRKENSSLALPECRAYEKVTPDGKEGFDALLKDFAGGERVLYESTAGNIAKSGQSLSGLKLNHYVATRSASGWETIANLNGPSGTIRDAPSYVTNPENPAVYSADLRSSIWPVNRLGGPPKANYYLRNPDGTFTLIGIGEPGPFAVPAMTGASDDLSHVFLSGTPQNATVWGPGVYEFVGTDNDQPRRADIDNSGAPITTCAYGTTYGQGYNASALFNSSDGRVFVFEVKGGCGGANPPTDEIWARVGGTASIDVSASQCTRVDCNAPSGPTFQGATKDGSRVLFTTSQQLLDADVDQGTDLYACDIPIGAPTPVDKANHCAELRQVSVGAPSGASIESVGAVSDNGATVVFTAKGVLAANEDALGEEAAFGDHNLYAWRADAAHPAGQTTFVGRLDSEDLQDEARQKPQVTPDGRYLVFTTASGLLETDTDTARDVYRYDADTGELTRASTNVFGLAGNGGSDAIASATTRSGLPVPSDGHNTHASISDDGQKVVFTTAEALSPADGNAEPDVYLWTPDRVSLISTGSVGGGARNASGLFAAISPSGNDIYFTTLGALTPADGDDIGDVYDARVGGGFSFAQSAPCSGEACLSPPSGSPALSAPVTTQPPADAGNVKPKTCPKGKVVKGKKCIKKKPKKNSGKRKYGKKAAHKRGGGR